MDRDKASCPNCGHQMVTERMDRQRAGGREVELLWVICQHCRHVRLERWEYLDVPGLPPGRMSRPDHR